MKYILFSEYHPEDRDKVVERVKKNYENREKNPEKYPTWLFPPHNLAGTTKGFRVVEATPEQLLNARIDWMPLMTFKAVPIFDSRRLADKYPKLIE